VKEVYLVPDSPATFPLKAAYEKSRRTVGEVVEEVSEPKAPDGWTPLFDVADEARSNLRSEEELKELALQRESKEPEPPAFQEIKQAVRGARSGVVKTEYGSTIHGRPTRKYATSKRPPNMWPETWQMLSPKDKLRAISEYEAQLALEEPAGDGMPNAAAVMLVEHFNPKMPTEPLGEEEHRENNSMFELPFSACVARTLDKKEIMQTKGAQEALLKEWAKLRSAGVWDEGAAEEWGVVSARARKNNSMAHVGLIFEICVEKNAELPKGDPKRNFKGRVVFQGNNVKDQNREYALFEESSSAPATMEAGKCADAFGQLSGHVAKQSDAEQACIQSKLGNNHTWVRIPKHRWPKSWIDKGFFDPVAPLKLALYGHPDSGGYWERHCEAILAKKGVHCCPRLEKLLLPPIIEDTSCRLCQ
jgi:hypothetical protein